MATIVNIDKLPKEATVREWEQLPDGIYLNIGFTAEIAYGDTEPLEMDGEPLEQGKETDVSRGTIVWVLRETYSGFRFKKIG